MKKILKVCVLLICVFLVSGCFGTKKLTCTNKTSDESGTTEMKAVYTYKGDKMTKAQMNMTMTVKEKSYVSLIEGSLKSSIDTFNKEDGVSAKLKTKGSTITMTMNIDIKKIAKDTFDEIGIDEGDYKTVKKDLENQGYTCK